MGFRWVEKPQSRSSTDNPPTMTLRGQAVGEFDEHLARINVRASTAGAILTPDLGTLWRQDIRMTAVGYCIYDVEIPYSGVKRETGSYTWNFDTTGATVHITTSKEHIASYPTNGNVHKGSINVRPDGEVEGTEIIIPALKLVVQYRHPHGVVTLPYIKQLARATGRTNADGFLTFDPGELLFLGATGSDGTEADAEVSFQFAASENASDLNFGDITGIVKKGHHYAWVEHKAATSDGRPATQPSIVHVERVYDEIAFATALGWS